MHRSIELRSEIKLKRSLNENVNLIRITETTLKNALSKKNIFKIMHLHVLLNRRKEITLSPI